MLTRRMFHTRLLAALAATTLPPVRAAWATSPSDDVWLNRLTFGANATSRADIARLGRVAWLDWQLSLPAMDPVLEEHLSSARLQIAYEAGEDENGNSWPALDEVRPLTALTADPADLVRLQEWGPGKGMDYSERTRPAQEVIAASLIRAVHAPAQLREVMTQFWHDHFNVNADKDETTAVFFASHDALLRTHAFGNFRTLLGEVARSPAMLYYLNNADSIASPANENYARELLELHTLGAANYLNDRYKTWIEVPGASGGLAEGYLDLDVYEVARAFTGWSVGDGRWLAEGEEAPRTGRFHYVARWHDPYQKRILGREFLPNRAPMADGDEVLDILSTHPGTAHFVCEKLARRFLSDDPSLTLVDQLAQVFLNTADAPDQIAQVLRALVLSPEFDAPPTKLRRPFEFLVAIQRASGAKVTATANDFHYQMKRAGWQQHTYGPPTGHPDRIGAWTGASTLNRYIDIALNAHEGWFGGVTIDLSAPASATETAGAFLARHLNLLAQSEEIVATLCDIYGIAPADPVESLDRDTRQNAATVALAFAALTPEGLLR